MALAVIGPIVGVWWGKLLVIVGAYVLTLGLGSRVVLHFVSAPASESQSAPEDADRPGAAPGPPKPRYDAGWLIGRCENIITVTFVLAGEATGLALIFAAKSMVRSDAIKQNPSYYLGGTLVNLVWGLVIASIARLLVFGM